MNGRFMDRQEAGRALAVGVREYAGRPDVVVLGLPRGGVPVAYEVARRLGAPLDVFVVRKLGVPGQEELAMGAIASGGVVVINDEVVNALRIPWELVEGAIEREQEELARREARYRGNRPPLEVEGKVVILVDDGLATGSTMRAAVAALRKQRPSKILVAVPTAAPSTCAEFRELADDCRCTITPEPFRAVGLWYEDFRQVSDQEVCDLLARAAAGEDSPIAEDPIPEMGLPTELPSR